MVIFNFHGRISVASSQEWESVLPEHHTHSACAPLYVTAHRFGD